jgi:uncharacterized membrane protein YcaP (DUF421 family)
VGIVFSLLVFIVIIALYALLTYFLGKSKKFEDMVEGKPVCLIRDGVFELENFKKENLGNDEFFAELRLRGISHLGQIETAIEETSGGVSVFFRETDEIRYGLPIMLNSLDNPLKQIERAGYYSCTFCGFTEEKAVGAAGNCSHCGKEKWVSASNNKRVT